MAIMITPVKPRVIGVLHALIMIVIAVGLGLLLLNLPY
jgi:hypothetical protein